MDNTKYRHKQGLKCFELVHCRLLQKWDVLWESTQKQVIQTSQNTQFMVEIDLHNFPLSDEKATWNCAWDLFLIRFFHRGERQNELLRWLLHDSVLLTETLKAVAHSTSNNKLRLERGATKRKVTITRAKQVSALALLCHCLLQASQTFLQLWMTN